MITTIQIHENIKNELEKFKISDKETYEDVIKNLIKEVEKNKRNNKELMIEGYKEMAEESLKITQEWETTDLSLDWEWE